MNTQRKRNAVAAVVLAAFAATAVPAWSDDLTAAGPAAPALRADRQAPSPEGPALAEYYLSTLAASSRRSRHLAGGIGLALGAVGIGTGLAILHDVKEKEEEWNPFLGLGYLGGILVITAGGAALAGGIVSLAVVSPAESRYAGIRGITDAGLREAACAEALEGLARKGKRWRMIRAALIGGLGLAGAVSSSGSDAPNSNLAVAACGGGLALLSVLVKSREEKAYRAYLERKGSGLGPELILGVGPHGGFRAGLSFEF
jgi:hypothetical protein